MTVRKQICDYFNKDGYAFNLQNEMNNFEIKLLDKNGNENKDWIPKISYYGDLISSNLRPVSSERNYSKESALTGNKLQYLDINVDSPYYEDEFEGYYSLRYKGKTNLNFVEVYRSTPVKFSSKKAIIESVVSNEFSINKVIYGAMTLSLQSEDSLCKNFTAELVDEKDNIISNSKVTVDEVGGAYRQVNIYLPENSKNYSINAKVKIYKNKEIFIESGFNTYNYYNWEINHTKNYEGGNTDECYVSNFAKITISYMTINDIEFYFENKWGQKIEGLEIRKAYSTSGFTTTIDLDVDTEKNSETVLTNIYLVAKQTDSSVIYNKYYYDALFLKYMFRGTSLLPVEESCTNSCLVSHHKKDSSDWGDSQGDNYLAPFVPGWADDFEKNLPQANWPSFGWMPLFSLNHPHQLNLNEGFMYFRVFVKQKNNWDLVKDFCKTKYILKQDANGTDIQIWRIYFDNDKQLEKILDKEVKCEIIYSILVDTDLDLYVGKVIGTGNFIPDVGHIQRHNN